MGSVRGAQGCAYSLFDRAVAQHSLIVGSNEGAAVGHCDRRHVSVHRVGAPKARTEPSECKSHS